MTSSEHAETSNSTSGLSLEQANFLFFQASSLVLAIFYRTVLHPHRVSRTSRHVVATVIGLYIGFYCYSWSMFHLLLQSTIAYVLMKILNPRVMPKIVFVFAILYLSVEHVRQLLRSFTADLDHIGPMMVITQRITSLAFGIHDGFCVDNSKLNPKQRELAVRRFPTIIEYYSYIFHFQALAVGPFCFYNHYIKFVEGEYLVATRTIGDNGKEVVVYNDPPVAATVFRKLLTGCIIGVIVFYSSLYYPIIGNVSEEIKASSIFYRILYLEISIKTMQFKYIFAWTIADAICNSSGLGFNGYNEHGEPKWDLVTNVRIIPFLLATNLKEVVDSWHIPAAHWLQYVCHDRVPRYKNALTYSLSCIWHGFHPGYLWTVANAFFVVMASKKVRQNIRPYFTENYHMKLFYDVITWLSNSLALQYIFIPFMLLVNNSIIEFYSSVYFCGHFIILAMILILPASTSSSKKAHNSKSTMTSPANGTTSSDTNNYTDDTLYKVKGD
ncbi:membrane-bound glycerophospholipid O-acyltransferase 2-like [Glandiceps talaboti]